jgi:glutathione peroxidase-family protein
MTDLPKSFVFRPTRLLLGLMLLSVLGAWRQPEAAPGYGIGDAVANFRLRNVDGTTVSLGDFAQRKGLIVVFTCNHCPFSRAYEDRLIALHQRYQPQGFPVVAINPNDPAAYEEDSFENMKLRAREKAYPFPYLLDESQDVARAFGATRTPHAFVLRRDGDRFTVQYIGALDDNSQDASGVTRRFVEDAVNNLLAGKPVSLNTTKSVGCAIKWKGM